MLDWQWYSTCKCGCLLKQLYWKNEDLNATKAPFMLTTKVMATTPRNEPKNKFQDTSFSPDTSIGRIIQNISMLAMIVKIQNTKNAWICKKKKNTLSSYQKKIVLTQKIFFNTNVSSVSAARHVVIVTTTLKLVFFLTCDGISITQGALLRARQPAISAWFLKPSRG